VRRSFALTDVTLVLQDWPYDRYGQKKKLFAHLAGQKGPMSHELLSAPRPGGADDGADARASIVIWLCRRIVTGVFLLWAAFAWVDENRAARGRCFQLAATDLSRTRKVPFWPSLAVGEGDQPEKGDVLANGCTARSSVLRVILRDQISAFEIRRLRLEAELRGNTDFDVAERL